MKTFTESIQNLTRHRFMSIATIISISLILVIFNVILAVNSITQNSIDTLSKKINLSIYFTEEADETQISEIENYIKEFKEVISTKIVSKEEAINLVTSKYPESIDFMQSFDIENPLPASIQIITKKLEDQNKIKSELEASKFEPLILKSEIKNQSNENINQVIQNLIQVKKFSFQIILWMIITFLISGGLIIYNSLRTSLHNRKSEIQIMQFVGAKIKRIILPFVFEGAIIGTASFLLSLLLLYLLLIFTPFTTNLLTTPNLLLILLSELIISISIGVLTSMHAVNAYLNSKQIFDQHG